MSRLKRDNWTSNDSRRVDCPCSIFPAAAVADPQFSGNDDLAPDRVQSGSVFLTDETRQLQEDISLILAISGSIVAKRCLPFAQAASLVWIVIKKTANGP